jgi:TonB family protein
LNVLLCGQTARALLSGAAATHTAGLAIIAAVVTTWSSTAWSQAKAGESVDSMEVSEHARRQADGPMRWIMLADQPKAAAKPATPAPAAKPQAAADKAATVSQPAPAPAKRPAVAATKPAGTPAPATSEPATRAATADTSLPAPEPKQEVALATPSPQPVVAPAAAAPEPQPEPEIVLKLVDMVEPVIPDALRSRLGKKASVVVHFAVAANGAVTDPEIVSASNNELKKPVLAAVKQWRYAAPGKRVEKQIELQIVAEE